jgi:hypothetical protein
MKYDCILINGDSYSASIPNKKVYGDFLSEHFNIPVRNYAIRGSNNQRILRSSIEHLHKIKAEFQNPLVIIGWSFVRRLEVWYYGNNEKLINQMPDSSQSRFITIGHVINAGEATLEQKALINEDLFVHKQLMDFYTNLYMFAHILELQNINYVFFSAAKNTDCPVHCFSYIESLQQVKWIANNPNIFKLHDFCIMDWAKDNDPECHPVTGHLSEDGHKKFSNFILNNLLD